MNKQKIITFINEKGGAGKTTTALNFAVGLALKNFKVVILDADPNKNLSLVSKLRTNKELIISPALKETQIKEEDKQGIRSQLNKKNALDFFRSFTPHKEVNYYKNYDYIIIDSPGRVLDVGGKNPEELAASAVSCADLIIIPLNASPLEVIGSNAVIKLIRAVNTAKAKRNKTPSQYLFSINREKTFTRLAKAVRKQIHNLYDIPDKGTAGKVKIFNTVIVERIIYQEAMLKGESVLEYQKFGLANQEINKLVKETLNILKK